MDRITQETRQLSFEDAVANGQYMRAAVVAVLVGKPAGLTAEEVASALNKPAYQVRPRLTELLEESKVVVIGKRVSSVTGKKIAVWRLP